MSAQVVVIVDVRLKPGKAVDFARWSEENLGDTRAWDGCIGVDAYTDPADPQAAAFVEHWRSRSDHEAYGRWRRETDSAKSLGALFEGPPTVRYLELAKT
jgi:quinol monooxygenase YgiN